MFRFFQDCDKTLSPEIADQFEREANNFARFALFKGDTYAAYAADCAFEIKTPMKLAKKFGASLYASAREFARTNHRACVVYVLEPLEYVKATACGPWSGGSKPHPPLRCSSVKPPSEGDARSFPVAGHADRPEDDTARFAVDERQEWPGSRMHRRGLRHDLQHPGPALSAEGLDEQHDRSSGSLRMTRTA